MDRTAVLSSSLREMQATLELVNDKLRAIRLADLTVEAFGNVLDARLEVAGVIGRLRHYTAQETV